MAQNKTQPTTESVAAFLDRQTDEQRWVDCQTLVAMMQSATQSEPVMWGKDIVGFGKQNYYYSSGRSGEWFVMGFSPRKQALTLYITANLESHTEQLDQLGTYKRGVGCLYVKRLEDIDTAVLQELFAQVAAEAPAPTSENGNGIEA